MFDMSPASLIFIHVIGIIGVFAMGYHFGQKKAVAMKGQKAKR
mgnify:CR=1 FL=1